MKTIAQVRALEKAAIEAGSSEDELMERAGEGIARQITFHFPRPGHLAACLGRGHNAGDALVAARYLKSRGWKISLISPYPEGDWAALCQENLQRLGSHEGLRSSLEGLASVDLILDGLLGLGGRPGLAGELGALAVEMEEQRQQGAWLVSMDVPSGLDADTGASGQHTVAADLTLTVGCLKPGLIADEAVHYVGRLQVVPVEGLEDESGGDAVFDGRELRSLLPRRPYDFHKGKAGRVGIVAGSRGLTGAARLTAESALRGGAGLVTLFALREIYPILATCCPPEVMVREVDSWSEIDPTAYDVMAVGPGLGHEHQTDFERLLGKIDGPLVLDADGLNRIASEPDTWVRKEMVLTPHPGEMRRLLPEADKLDRERIARHWTERYPGVLLLKGARTLVAERGRSISYNGSGGPAMGSGGQGDVLTGLIAALIAQGLDGYDAARAGAYLAGRTADALVFSRKFNEQTLLAGDVAENFHLGITGVHQTASPAGK
ncbi:MAG: NAD(P)H-hydrate dehydratase [Verrucomicrobiota bacterium JB023]|nr:NAD(P)H-hydrate dehydratase [Verrucomicrobiota bacterium JB023]